MHSIGAGARGSPAETGRADLGFRGATPLTVAALKQGMNVCLVYDDPAQAIRLVAPYVAAGLAAGERCVYIVGEHDPTAIEWELAAAGVDADRARAGGQLVFVTHWEVSFPDGEFDPAAMISFVQAVIAQALAEGFAGLRIVAEMTWALELGVGFNKLIHYEALGCHLYPDQPLVAICLYDRARFPAAVCHDALRTHPLVVVGDEVHDNLFFEPPDAVIDRVTATARLETMLAQVERASTADREQQAREQAEAILRARTELLATISHDLQNPLAAIRGRVQLLRRRAARGPLTPEALTESLSSIEATADQLAMQIQELRDLAAMEAGKPVHLVREPVDLVVLAEEVLGAWQDPVDDVRLRLEATEEKLIAEVDRMRLRRVLSNLVSNAKKYSPHGGDVVLGVGRSDGQAVVSVRDDGLGIPPGDLPRLFERFYRASNAAPSVPGTGLGLAAVKQIVEAHGGSVEVESAEGVGSTFTVRLPLRLD